MKKKYILQEKQCSYICDTWLDKYESDDKNFLRKIKKVYEDKYCMLYRIIEVIYE